MSENPGPRALDLRGLGTRRSQLDRVSAPGDRVRHRRRTPTGALHGTKRDGGGDPASAVGVQREAPEQPVKDRAPAERVTKAAQPPDPLPVGGERLPSLVAQPGTPGARVVTGQAVPQLFPY